MPTVGNTFGSISTGIRVAGIRFFNTAGDGIRHRYITGQTFADRVAQSVHITPGVASTWTGEAWIRWRGPGFNSGTAGDGIRLGRKSGQAGAHRIALSVHIALSVGSTRSWLAGIRPRHTLVVLANVVSATVSVCLTFSSTASDGVRLGYIGGQASANRITRGGHAALGVRSTRRWVTWVRFDHTFVALANVSCLAISVNFTLSLTTRDSVRHWNESR